MTYIPLFIIFFCILCFYKVLTSEGDSDSPVDDPDINRNVSELITSKGYPVEEHCVETVDGYLLSVQRIPHGRKETNVDKKEVILLIHGVVADASHWLLNYPEQSLGFVLPDKGYDVWLLNTRGSAYSRKHIKYTTKHREFWDFSFDELVQYDVPATIDYILKSTDKEDLYIIAHSQGTAAVFGLLSEVPDYNKKVKLLIAIAPVAFIGHLSSSIARSLLPFANDIAFMVNIMDFGEFFPSKRVQIFNHRMCPRGCENLLTDMFGLEKTQMNKTRYDVYIAHMPASSSAKSLLHFTQMIKSGKFRKYDYGRRRNLKFYNQEEPPDYNLSRITTPIALFWSTNDKLIDIEDVEILRGKLKSLVFDYCIPQPFGHCDFLFGLDAPQLVNEPILGLLDKY